MLVRESALGLAHQKLDDARNEVLAQKARLEAKPGLLKGLSGKSNLEREQGLKTALNHKFHYDSQLKKAESLTALLNKETGRWLECSLKTGSPDYAAALSLHEYPEDWARFSYDFDLLIKSFQMGLQDIVVQFKRENQPASQSALIRDSIRKLLPVARQIEIDVEFFNRILTHKARARGPSAKATLQSEYSWCETTEQLATQSVDEALGMLRELLAACAGFLPSVAQVVKREQLIVEEKATHSPHLRAKPSFLRIWWDGLKPAAALGVKEEKLEAIITETESLLMEGEFSARFNRHMVQTMTPSPPQAGPERPSAAGSSSSSGTTPPIAVAPQSDAEVRSLKAQLRAELEEAAKAKTELAARERALRDAEQAFADKCLRDRAALDETRLKLNAREEELALKARQWEERQTEELARVEEAKKAVADREVFIEESEQRLMQKGQEQIERWAELEQQEDELMNIKRDLNGMRKELGMPLIPLRAKVADEFNE